MVTVIIPAYNVYDYIDKCLASVTAQTYSDIEIILINDGSGDGTDKKCGLWAARDRRVRYYSQPNRGLGASRNRGLELARGEYIMYVDADDWVDAGIVEKLYAKMRDGGAEMALCEYRVIHLQDESKNLVNHPEAPMDFIEMPAHKELIPLLPKSAWAKLYKKSFLQANHIQYPALYYEDIITLLMFALCRGICLVHEPLYYYVRDRADSIVNRPETFYHSLLPVFALVKAEFARRGLWAEYQSILRRTFSDIMVWSRNRLAGLLQKEVKAKQAVIDAFAQKQAQFMRDEFDYIPPAPLKQTPAPLKQAKVCVFGSYNLMAAAKILTQNTVAPFSGQHYSFSGLISAMAPYDPALAKLNAAHPNPYRRRHIIQDLKKAWRYSHRDEFKGAACVLIDFLEERFDLGRCGGSYFTLSDALLEVDADAASKYRRLARDSCQAWDLWRQQCRAFIAWLRIFFADKPLVLVKMKLAERYGLHGREEEFDNIAGIRRQNLIIERCYEFACAHYPDFMVIEVEADDSYFCDSDFRHGCYPWHLNQDMYAKISALIAEKFNEAHAGAVSGATENIILFGAGGEGRKALAFYGPERVRCFVDNSPHKQGAGYLGKPVISLAKLRALPADYRLTLALAPANAQEVIPQLTEAGIKEYEIFSEVLFYARPRQAAPVLAKLKNLYQGRRCFIIGNGPSLRPADLETLAAGGELTFACNKIFKAFAHSSWRPDLYCVIDNLILSYHLDTIINLNLPVMLLNYHAAGLAPEDLHALSADKENIHLFKIYHKEFWDSRLECFLPGFSPNPAKYITEGCSVTYAMLQWGAYMGFREMYLLGVDFDYKDPSGGNAGRLDYFCADYVEAGEAVKGTEYMDITLRAYQQAAAYAEKNGIKIYNATRGGKLEVFERVDFDELTAGFAAGQSGR
jgi:glycosyltransferase involved in cell wall biosynthesis